LGKGGYVAYFGTNNAYEIELMAIEGDEKARLIQDAMSYQIAKTIGAMATVLHGKVDGIILTGGLPIILWFVSILKRWSRSLPRS